MRSRSGSERCRRARDQLLASARTAAEQQDNIIHEAQSLLHVLVRVPGVTGPYSSGCHGLLQLVADDHPRIEVITIVDSSGKATCNSRDEQPSYNVADRAYFAELMVASPPDYAISRLIWGRGANRPVIVVAVPLAQNGSNGLPIGIAMASLNLDWFPRSSRIAAPADGRSIFVIDVQSGAIVATNARDAADGRRALPELAAAMGASRPDGVVEAPDLEGRTDVFGFAALPGTRGRMAVAVGIPEETILADAGRELKLNLALGVAAAIVTALLAYAVAHLWLLRPINRIVAAIREVGLGDRPRRVASDGIPIKELHVLATTINAMVDKIDSRDEELRSMHLALAASEQHHRELAENATDMISRLSPDFTRTYVSPSCKRLLGFEPEELIGRAARGIVHPDDWPLLDVTLNAPLRSGADDSCATYRASRKDGGEIWLESSSRRLPDGSGFVVVTRDVSERKRFEAALEEANARLEVHAHQDALTGLANRRVFNEALHTDWARSRRERNSISLILADIDFFKDYNDTLGHQAGDDCLRLVGKALASVRSRPGDIVARYGGEEFAAILPSTDLAGAEAVGERMLQAVRSLRIPHPKNPSLIVTVSVGVAYSEMLPINARSPDGLLQTADNALYQAKRGGRNTIRMSYDPVSICPDPNS